MSDNGLSKDKCSYKPQTKENPEIDYLAKDFDSFLRVMQERMDLLLPDWNTNIPADLTETILETLAYGADNLSYFLDSVTTEQYIETARNRISIRRHARLVDYKQTEGCGSRLFAHINVESDMIPLSIKLKGKQDNKDHIYEMVHCPTLSKVFNNPLRIRPLDPDKECIERGDTSALISIPEKLSTLQDVFDVFIGKGFSKGFMIKYIEKIAKLFEDRVIVLVEQYDMNGLMSPKYRRQALFIKHAWPVGEDCIGVQWSQEDKAKDCFCTNITPYGEYSSVCHANIAFFDSGMTVDEDITPVLRSRHLTHVLKRENLVFHNMISTKFNSVQELVSTDPAIAIPAIEISEITSGGMQLPWKPRFDLLESRSADRHFAVEIDNNRRAYIRFGDGENGAIPYGDSTLKAKYRIGTQGEESVMPLSNLEIGYIEYLDSKRKKHVLESGGGAISIQLPSFGSQRWSSVDRTRHDAPGYLTIQNRAVSLEDYERIACLHPDVLFASASRHWNGSWRCRRIRIIRNSGDPLDNDFIRELLNHFDQYKMTCQDVDIVPGICVPVNITIKPQLACRDCRNAVGLELESRFSGGFYEGEPAFFNPQRWHFGKELYRSQVCAEALKVDNVDSVEISTLDKWLGSSDLDVIKVTADETICSGEFKVEGGFK